MVLMGQIFTLLLVFVIIWGVIVWLTYLNEDCRPGADGGDTMAAFWIIGPGCGAIGALLFFLFLM
jgi:hypothetical protein